MVLRQVGEIPRNKNFLLYSENCFSTLNVLHDPKNKRDFGPF